MESLKNTMSSMLKCPQRKSISTPTNAVAASAAFPEKDSLSSARHSNRPPRHYILHFICLTLILLTHQALAQSTVDDSNGNGTPENREGMTTSDPTDDRRGAGGDGIRNGRWGGRRRRRLSRAAVVGICIGIVIVFVDLMILLIWLRRRKLRKAQDQAREALAQEQEANMIGRDSGIISLKLDTDGSAFSPLSFPPPGEHGGSGGAPSRHSNSFQRLSRYGSAKWKEFRLMGSRDKPTPPAPKPKKQVAHSLSLYTPPTFDSIGDQDEDEDPTPASSPPPPPRLPEMQGGSKDEITIQLDPSLSLHTLSPETANASVVKLEGFASTPDTQWSPSSPASSSTAPGYPPHQQLWSTPDSPSGQPTPNSYYHDSSSGYRSS